MEGLRWLGKTRSSLEINASQHGEWARRQTKKTFTQPVVRTINPSTLKLIAIGYWTP
jgi:hypothetical protein